MAFALALDLPFALALIFAAGLGFAAGLDFAAAETLAFGVALALALVFGVGSNLGTARALFFGDAALGTTGALSSESVRSVTGGRTSAMSESAMERNYDSLRTAIVGY